MSILVLGGRGKTASRLAELLYTSNKPFIVASRSKSDTSLHKQDYFDWNDQQTWAPVLKHADPPIKAVYLVLPRVTDPAPIVNAFIDQAQHAGVERFVLLSAAPIEAGGRAHGQVHQYLINSGLSYCVLRPTWFMENFSEKQHLPTIRNEGKIYSATRTGRIPWVSAEDIAAVAFKALTDETSHDTDHIILGPELLSYADCARILSESLDREVEHVNLATEELYERRKGQGVQDGYAQALAKMDEKIANGAEDRLNQTVEQLTGRPPRTFKDFVEKNRAAWS